MIDFTFRVTDLKQYTYCPRILYYHVVLPTVRPTTDKMAVGIAAHERAEGRERRRSLRSYGLGAGERHFNVPLYDADLGLSGELDLLIETGDELIPVDYKHTSRAGEHFHLQLMAYAHLLERTWPGARPVRRGFLYLIPRREAVEIRFTKKLRRQLADALETMRTIASLQRLPPPTARRRRCVDCEFRRFCNDVL